MIDFGLVDAVDAEAIGVPGERTFRIRARSGANRASLWMEKEQLTALGRAFSQVLAERSRQRGRPAEHPAEMGDFEGEADVELRVARLGLDFDEEQERVVLLVDDGEALESGNTPAFRMEISRSMAMALIASIPPIVASGRPLCPLCGRPLEGDAEHFCPGANGHSEEPIPEVGQDEQEEDGDRQE